LDRFDGAVDERIFHGDDERVPLAAATAHQNRNKSEAIGELAGDEIEEWARELDVVERNPRHAELLGEDLRQQRLAHEPPLDEDLTELLPRRSRQFQGEIELVRRQDLGFQKELAELRFRHVGEHT